MFLAFIFLIFPFFVLTADKVEINTASLEQLDKIVGIGPTLAQRIIEARPFSSVDDLLRVKGIGEKTLQKIKDQGLAYVENSASEIETATSDVATATSDVHQTYPTGIVINEILPSPEGADDQNEWIELYNQNNFEVDLSSWKIEDMEGVKTVYIFNKNTKIAPNGYLILKRRETKITLNNTEDGLSLLNPNQKIVDFLDYSNAPRNQSYNKTSSSWAWSSFLTPGLKNNIYENRQNNKNEIPAISKNLPNSKKSDITNKIEGDNFISKEIGAGTATISRNTNPWFLFFTAMIITIISGIVALFIKFKFLKQL
ncbi:MAG: competence protein ComEA [Parcubacteria group bacterium Licking1014_1]|nr:MAG: competence protein ComEA [Parcubacteria group bacterium Licking1014_1]